MESQVQEMRRESMKQMQMIQMSFNQQMRYERSVISRRSSIKSHVDEGQDQLKPIPTQSSFQV